MTPDGREYFMTFELQGPAGSDRSGDPHIGIRYLPGPSAGAASPTYLTALTWNESGGHISCQGTGEFCAISTYPDGGQPFSNEIFLQYVDGRVLRVAHHRSRSNGYWTQPRPSLSPDSRRVIFASDWGLNRSCNSDGLGCGDAYVIELPDNVRTGPSSNPVSSGSSDNSTTEPGTESGDSSANDYDSSNSGESDDTDNSNSGNSSSGSTGTSVSALPANTNVDIETDRINGAPSGSFYLRMNDHLTDSDDQYCLDEEPWLSGIQEEVYVRSGSGGNWTVPTWRLDYSICNTRLSREYSVTPASPGSYQVSICVDNRQNDFHYCSDPISVSTN